MTWPALCDLSSMVRMPTAITHGSMALENAWVSSPAQDGRELQGVGSCIPSTDSTRQSS